MNSWGNGFSDLPKVTVLHHAAKDPMAQLCLQGNRGCVFMIMEKDVEKKKATYLSHSTFLLLISFNSAGFSKVLFFLLTFKIIFCLH